MIKLSKKYIRILLIAVASAAVAAAFFVLISNLIIVNEGKKKLLKEEKPGDFEADCILILGAGVWGDSPSPMLSDRLDEGLRLYREGYAGKILVSGDHGSSDYDEVNVMKKYLVDAGVPSEDVFMDHAGFSTYESIYRAKAVFGVKKVIVVTQKYHIYRALYICDKLGIEAYGSNSDPRSYRGETYRNIREWLARDKDIFTCLFNVKPKYLGEKIDISGNGDVTND